jgi:hypothetical protein
MTNKRKRNYSFSTVFLLCGGGTKNKGVNNITPLLSVPRSTAQQNAMSHAPFGAQLNHVCCVFIKIRGFRARQQPKLRYLNV